MVAGEGFFVSGATGGAAMQEILARPDHGIDVVILDWLLPGEATAELVLHVAGLRLPIVIVSGDPNVEDFATSRGLQCLHKPFRVAELRGAIETALTGGGSTPLLTASAGLPGARSA
jgi:DNA-binding response OmpR family regulator